MVLLLSFLGIIVLIAGLIGTLALAGKGDAEYSKSTKANVTRLTLIYIILIILLIIGIALYLIL